VIGGDALVGQPAEGCGTDGRLLGPIWPTCREARCHCSYHYSLNLILLACNHLLDFGGSHLRAMSTASSGPAYASISQRPSRALWCCPASAVADGRRLSSLMSSDFAPSKCNLTCVFVRGPGTDRPDRPSLSDELSHRDRSAIDDPRTSAIREERYVVSVESDCVYEPVAIGKSQFGNLLADSSNSVTAQEARSCQPE